VTATLSSEVDLSTDALVVGTNRLSVEVHQGVTNSSDIVFGAELKIETAVDPTLELYDAGTNLVATAVSSNNADFVISDFVAPETGTYYARVAGGNSDYSVLVTRGIAFDTEPNNDVDTQAQDISQGVGALGHVASGVTEGDSVRFAIFGEYGVTGSNPQAVAVQGPSVPKSNGVVTGVLAEPTRTSRPAGALMVTHVFLPVG
jgi:hypothetical protein